MVFVPRDDARLSLLSAELFIRSTTLRVRATIIVILLTLLLVVTALAVWLARVVTKPIEQLAAVSHAIILESSRERRNYGALAAAVTPAQTGDELEVLMDNFAAVVKRLDEVGPCARAREICLLCVVSRMKGVGARRGVCVRAVSQRPHPCVCSHLCRGRHFGTSGAVP